MGDKMSDMDRIYERLERLEKTAIEQAAFLGELRRRVDGVEQILGDIHELRSTLVRLEGRMEVLLARMNTWQSIVWALLTIVIGGLIAAGFKLFEGG